MASYFVLDNKFTPYTFEELIKPYQLYNEAYEKQEAALSDLNTTASTIESLISQENDPIAYARYSNYINSVRDAANQLYSKGLMPSTRSNVYRLRGNYSQDILPIITAASRRKELQDEQRKALANNPTIRYQRNFNTISDASSIDRFLENPNYDYGSSFTGSLLTKQVSDQVSSMAKELSEIGTKPLDKYTNIFIQRHGFTRQQVQDAINNPTDPNSSKVLTALVENVVDASGVKEWGNESDIKEAYRYANMGLYSGIGETKMSTYENYGTRLAARIAAENRAKEQTLKPKGFDYRNTYTQKEIDKAKKDSDTLKKYASYFDVETRPDGSKHYKLNDKGRRAATITEREYASPDGVRKGTVYGSGEFSIGAEEFVKFLQENNLGNLVKTSSNNNPARESADLDAVMTNVQDKYNSIINGVYDATAHTEYTKSIATEDYDNVLNIIYSRSNNGKIGTATWAKDDDGNYTLDKSAGNIDVKDISKDKVKSMQAVTGVSGNYVEIKTDENIYKIPLENIHNRASVNASGDMKTVSDMAADKEAGLKSLDGIPVEVLIENLTDDALNNVIQSFRETRPEAEKI